MMERHLRLMLFFVLLILIGLMVLMGLTIAGVR
jgi:hypothetical protein